MLWFNTWSKMKKKLHNNEIDVLGFVNALRFQKVFYSTPIGEDKQGNNQLYILNSGNSETKYYPAFLTIESCLSFFNSMGRIHFMIIEGDLKSLLDSLDTSPILSECGAIIEPNSVDEFAIQPKIRVTL